MLGSQNGRGPTGIIGRDQNRLMAGSPARSEKPLYGDGIVERTPLACAVPYDDFWTSETTIQSLQKPHRV
jgi:hypothetical protein